MYPDKFKVSPDKIRVFCCGDLILNAEPKPGELKNGKGSLSTVTLLS